MGKYVFLILLFLTGAHASFAQNKLKVIELKDTDSNKIVTAVAGQEISLRLSENPSTGYTWAIKEPGPDKIKLLDDKYETNPRFKGRNGAGGTHLFHYKILKAGAMELILINSRSWEKEPKFSQRYRVTLKVR